MFPTGLFPGVIVISTADQVADEVLLNVTPQTSTARLVTPLSPDGTKMYLVKGDTYATSNGRSLRFDIAGRSDLVNTVAHLRFEGSGSDACFSQSINLPSETIIMGDLSAIYTNTLPVSNSLNYQLRFIDNMGSITTVINGSAIVIAGL